jgi:hypothetical protein
VLLGNLSPGLVESSLNPHSVSLAVFLPEFAYVFVSYMNARSAPLSLSLSLSVQLTQAQKMYTQFNRGYVRTFSKLNGNGMYGV